MQMQSGGRLHKQIHTLSLLVFGVLSGMGLFTGCSDRLSAVFQHGTVVSADSAYGYADESGMLTVTQIASLRKENALPPAFSERGVPDCGGSYWLAADLPDAAVCAEPLVVYLGPGIVARADLYAYRRSPDSASAQLVLLDSAGYRAANDEKRIVSWRTVLEIPPEFSGGTVFVRIECGGPFAVFWDFYPVSVFYARMSVLLSLQLLLLGGMCAAAAGFAFFFFVKREKLFSYLCLFSVFSALYQCAEKGFGAAYLWNVFADTRFFARIGFVFLAAAFFSVQAIFIRTALGHYSEHRGRPARRRFVFFCVCTVCVAVSYLLPTDMKIPYVAAGLIASVCFAYAVYGVLKKIGCRRSVSAALCFYPIALFVFRSYCVCLPAGLYTLPFRAAAAVDFYFGYDAVFVLTAVIGCCAVRPQLEAQRFRLIHSQLAPILTGVARDLMTPITLLRNMLGDAGYMPETIASFVRIFADGCTRMADAAFLAKTLDEQERSVAVMRKNCVPVAFVPLFKNISDSFMPYLELHGKRLEFSADCRDRAAVYAFPLFLKTVCYNIFNTAVTYGAENAPVRVELNWDPDTENLVYRVHVTSGVPVPPQPFYEQVLNVGLGFVSRICALYGGVFSTDCRLESGNGTSPRYTRYTAVFTASLFLQTCTAGVFAERGDSCVSGFSCDSAEFGPFCPPGGTVQPAAALLPVLHKSTVLLVTDDVALLRLLSGLFADSARVVTAGHGQSALEVMQKTVPDIVIADMQLPVMSGGTLYRLCRGSSQLSHIPFLMMCEGSDSRARHELLADGVLDFVVKPIEPDELFLKACAVLSVCAGVRKKYAQTVLQLVTEAAETNACAERSPFGGDFRPEMAPQQTARTALYAKRNLSPREIEIGELLYDNYSNKQIAERLGIAVSTVATHIQHIYEKCSVRNRNEWIRFMTGM